MDNPPQKRKEIKVPKGVLGDGLKMYHAQHGHTNAKIKKTNKPDIKGLVEVGTVEEIVYTPPSGSKKEPYKYRHELGTSKGDRKLYASVSPDGVGKYLLLGIDGNTFLDKDGWLKEKGER